MSHITRESVHSPHADKPLAMWPLYRKTMLTPAVRVDGPFTVETQEGPLTCPDGYLAVDASGWPYPIAREDFERMYERAD